MACAWAIGMAGEFTYLANRCDGWGVSCLERCAAEREGAKSAKEDAKQADPIVDE